MALWMKSALKKSTKKNNNPLTTKAAPHRQEIVYGAPLLFSLKSHRLDPIRSVSGRPLVSLQTHPS